MIVATEQKFLSPKSDNKEYIWQGGKLGLGLQFYVELAIANTLFVLLQYSVNSYVIDWKWES